MIYRMFFLKSFSKCLKQLVYCVALLVVTGFPVFGSRPAQAASSADVSLSNPGSSPYDVLNLVNQLRTARGLTALQANTALMNAAQKHSEYQAAVHSITHYGPGGNSVKDRATAAGYGDGASFSVTENIYGGTNATAQNAVNWWQGDAPHLNTLLGAKYTDAGVGVATDGNLVYYTLDVGYLLGAPGASGTGITGATQVPGSTPVTFNLVQIASPMPDGSIVHTVQSGQTLWTIAAIYKVDLQELLKLNKFTENTLIYVGQKVIVKEPDAPGTPTPSPTITPTHTQKATLIPRRTATKVIPATSVAEQVDSPGNRPATTKPVIDPILATIGGLVGGGLILVLAGSLLSARKTNK